MPQGIGRASGPSPDALQVGVASERLRVNLGKVSAATALATGDWTGAGPSPDALQVGVASERLRVNRP